MINTCAKCGNTVYNNDHVKINSPIGIITVFLCAEHFAEMMRANLAIQLAKLKGDKEV